MPRQVPLSRGIESQFEELLVHSKAWTEAFRQVAHDQLSVDPRENAEANLAIAREFFTKWTIDILVILYSLHAVGFEELRRHLRGITPRVLSGRLKSLEARRLIIRRVLNDRPPRVQYRLAPDGLALVQLGEPALLFLRIRSKTPR